MHNYLPISVIIATANRRHSLQRTMESMYKQNTLPEEIIIVDASENDDTFEFWKEQLQDINHVVYFRATEKGAAKQRNQGLKKAKFHIVGFMDDDLLFESDVYLNLFNVLTSAPAIGGVSAFIVNQYHQRPGRATRLFFRMLDDRNLESYGGKVIGPVINFLPEKDSRDLQTEVEWLNTTMTLYKYDALPEPVFDPHFAGYSFMEDVSLSLKVCQQWKLYNVRNARVFHDSQRSDEKSNVALMSEMDLVNRFFIMKTVLHNINASATLKLILHQLFVTVATGKIFNSAHWKGKWRGMKRIFELKKSL